MDKSPSLGPSEGASGPSRGPFVDVFFDVLVKLAILDDFLTILAGFLGFKM